LPLTKEKASLYEIARKVLEEATTTALGPTCNTVITFHLKQKFGKDPCQVFIDDPKAFYSALEEIFGAGAQSIMNVVATFLRNKYGMAYNAEEFVNLMVKSDKISKNKLEEILSSTVSGT
jgi:hypothetical protein